MRKETRNDEIIQAAFFEHYVEGEKAVLVPRDYLREATIGQGNPGDLPYNYRNNRRKLPQPIRVLADDGMAWALLNSNDDLVFLQRPKINYRYLDGDECELIIPPPISGKIGEQYAIAVIAQNHLVTHLIGRTARFEQAHLKFGGRAEIDGLFTTMLNGVRMLLPVHAKTDNEKELGYFTLHNTQMILGKKYPDFLVEHIYVHVMGDRIYMLHLALNMESGVVTQKNAKRFVVRYDS